MNLLNVRLIQSDGHHRITGDGIDLAFPENGVSSPDLWTSRECVLGIRPEHIHPVSDKEPQQGGALIEGIVEFYEPLGPETVIHFRVGSQEILSIGDPDSTPALDRKMGFSIDMGKIHLFDPSSGAVLPLSGGQ